MNCKEGMMISEADGCDGIVIENNLTLYIGWLLLKLQHSNQNTVKDFM